MTREFNVHHRLLKDRIVFLPGKVCDASANRIVAELLFLEAEDPKKDIYMYINSPGGSITSGLAIFDTMNHIAPDVNTIALGQACSMGSYLLAAGTKGKRFSLPNTTIMIHQPSGGAIGQASDIEIRTDLIKRYKNKLNRDYAKFTGKKLSVIEKAMDRDNFMTAEEALKFGLIDKIIKKIPSKLHEK